MAGSRVPPVGQGGGRAPGATSCTPLVNWWTSARLSAAGSAGRTLGGLANVVQVRHVILAAGERTRPETAGSSHSPVVICGGAAPLREKVA